MLFKDRPLAAHSIKGGLGARSFRLWHPHPLRCSVPRGFQHILIVGAICQSRCGGVPQLARRLSERCPSGYAIGVEARR